MNKLPPQTTQTRNTRPVHEVRIGLIKAAIWGNTTEEGIRHNVTFERRYRDFLAMPLHINGHVDRITEQLGRISLGLPAQNLI